jgi:hypothetical protein
MRLNGYVLSCFLFSTFIACQQNPEGGQKDRIDNERIDAMTKAFILEQDAFFSRVATKHFKEGEFSNFKIGEATKLLSPLYKMKVKIEITKVDYCDLEVKVDLPENKLSGEECYFSVFVKYEAYSTEAKEYGKRDDSNPLTLSVADWLVLDKQGTYYKPLTGKNAEWITKDKFECPSEGKLPKLEYSSKMVNGKKCEGWVTFKVPKNMKANKLIFTQMTFQNTPSESFSFGFL